MVRKRRMKDKLLAIALSIMVMVTFVPLMGGVAYAADNSQTYLELYTDASATNATNTYSEDNLAIYIRANCAAEDEYWPWLGIYPGSLDLTTWNKDIPAMIWAYSDTNYGDGQGSAYNGDNAVDIFGNNQGYGTGYSIDSFAPGNYTAILFKSYNDYGPIAYKQFTITEGTIVPGEPSFTTDKANYKYGEAINITTSMNGSSNNGWAAVFKKNQYDGETTYGQSLIWYYTSDGQVKDINTITSSVSDQGIGQDYDGTGLPGGEYKVVYLDGNYNIKGEPTFFNVFYEYNGPGDGDWEWEDDYSSATATFKANGKETETKTLTDNAPTSNVTKAATCEETGTTVHSASVTVDDEFVLADPDTKTFTAEATETTDALGHKWGEWSNDPNNPGHQIRHCTRDGCDATDTREAHDHEMTEIPAKAPTCTEPGNNKYYQCDICKYYYKDETGETETTVAAETLAALGHDFDGVEWVYDSENKQHSRTCKREDCNYKETANCTFEKDSESNGVITYACTVCNGTYTETVLKTDKETYGFFDPIMVTAKGTGKDWVGLYAADATPGAEGAISYYYYYPADQSEATVDIKLDKFKQKALDAGGNYKIVLLANDGYDVIASVPITITSPQSSLAVADKSNLVYGDPIKVTASSEYPDAWVGYYDYEDELTKLDETYYRSYTVGEHDGEEVNIFDMDEFFTDRPIVAKRYRVVLFSSGYAVDKIVTFTVNPKDMQAESITVDPIADVPHSGSAVTPDVVVKDTVYGKETTLVKDTDYEVAYSDNTEVGTATITITGKGNYTGTREIKFNINHDLEEVAANPATCTKAGNDKYYKCKVEGCGKLFTDSEGKTPTTLEDVTIKALDHDFGEWTVSKPSSCSEEGEETRKCSRCSTTETRNIEIAAHEWKDEYTIDQEPTCTTDGSKSKHCKNCEAVTDSQTIAALGHDYQDVAGSAKAATCTAAGKEADQKCSRCNAEKPGAAIAALGHDYQEVAGSAKAATCTEAGKEADKECSRCHDVIPGKAIAALGHDYQVVEGTAKEATYTEAGKEADQKCSRCDSFIEGAVIPALPVTAVKPVVKLSAYKYTYTGKVKKPTITVTANGKTLTANDYTVSYNTKRYGVGKHTVTVTLKDAYSGTASTYFRILPKKPVVASAAVGKKKMTVKMKTKVSATGAKVYQIAYKVKGTSKWKYTTTTKQSKVIYKLKTGKVYQVKVRAYKMIGKTKYYGAWSKVKVTKKIK